MSQIWDFCDLLGSDMFHVRHDPFVPEVVRKSGGPDLEEFDKALHGWNGLRYVGDELAEQFVWLDKDPGRQQEGKHVALGIIFGELCISRLLSFCYWNYYIEITSSNWTENRAESGSSNLVRASSEPETIWPSKYSTPYKPRTAFDWL